MCEYQSEDITKLAKALLAVQKVLQPAVKDALNPFAKNKYATLNSIMDVCREHLIDNGIWLTQYPVPVEVGHMGLVTKLTHAETGQWQSGLLMMPLAKSDPQGYGSAMTYARRYALSALLGIVTEEDDDGQGGMPATKSTNRKRQVQQAKQPAEKDNASNAESEFEQDTRARKAKSGDINESISPPTNVVHPALKTMPKLDGVDYSTTVTKDGKTCIIATGNTANKKQILSQAGFTWNVQRKLWWRYIDAA